MDAIVTGSALVTLLSASAVFWAAFCRLAKASRHVFASVRVGIVALASVAILAIFLPLFGWWTPDPMSAAVMSSVAVYMVSTSRQWRHSVPHAYLRKSAP